MELVPESPWYIRMTEPPLMNTGNWYSLVGTGSLACSVEEKVETPE